MEQEQSRRSKLAAVFGYPGVARAYRHRPHRVLDIGAGEEALARPLASRADHVDAVEISAAMVRTGRTPRTACPTCRWQPN